MLSYRPQTAIGVDQSFSFNPKSDEVENENFEEDEEDIDHELDDLLRKSTQNLNCLKEEIQYILFNLGIYKPKQLLIVIVLRR